MASQLQTRHLLDRLNRVQVKYPADPVEPADVKAARKLIAAFEKKRRAARGKAFAAFNASLTATEDAAAAATAVGASALADSAPPSFVGFSATAAPPSFWVVGSCSNAGLVVGFLSAIVFFPVSVTYTKTTFRTLLS